jgi:type I restriction-modification system DNA methylase subunit
MSKKTSSVRNIKKRDNPNDIIHTPPSVAHIMIDMCQLKDGELVLDPSAGSNKIFYNAFQNYVRKDYCEITEGKDFFEYHNKVDCVIGNPPYSMWDKWLEHTMSITDKFCYIFGSLNFTPARLTKIINSGYGVTRIHMLNIDW